MLFRSGTFGTTLTWTRNAADNTWDTGGGVSVPLANCTQCPGTGYSYGGTACAASCPAGATVRPMGEGVAVLHRAVGVQDNLTLFARGPDGAPRICQVSLLSASEVAAPGPRPWVNAYDALALDAATVIVSRHRLSSLVVVDVAAGSVAQIGRAHV